MEQKHPFVQHRGQMILEENWSLTHLKLLSREPEKAMVRQASASCWEALRVTRGPEFSQKGNHFYLSGATGEAVFRPASRNPWATTWVMPSKKRDVH